MAAMTTAHRTSGAAPLAVFFDAVDNSAASSPTYTFAWTSGVVQPSDMEGTLYSWDFGDTGAGTWTYGRGSSRNAATGYTAAHVYESAGNYTVTLTVTQTDGTVNTYTQTITVSAWSGDTYYAAATPVGAEDGSSEANAGSFANGMTWVRAASNRRLLLKRGDTFNVSSNYAITTAGPGIIGAYGSGAKPIISYSEMGDLQVFQTLAADWRIMDIDFRGPDAESATGPAGPWPATAQAVNLLLLNLSLRGSNVGFGWSYQHDTGVSTPHDAVFVVNCDQPVRAGGYGAFVGGRRLVIMGNQIRGGTVFDTHALRIWQAHKAVISNNSLTEPNESARHALKMHGIQDLGDGWAYDTAPETRWVTISDNILEGGVGQWTMSIGSQSGEAVEAASVTHLVIERNHFTDGPATGTQIQSEASNVVVRNNIFVNTSGGYSCVLWQQRNTLVTAPHDVRLYNNTAYNATAFLETNSSLTNARVRNNVVSLPSGSPVLVDGTAGTGYAAETNLVSSAAVATIFTDAANDDFTLAAGSAAIDQGTTLGDVREDFARTSRTGTYDIGAYADASEGGTALTKRISLPAGEHRIRIAYVSGDTFTIQPLTVTTVTFEQEDGAYVTDALGVALGAGLSAIQSDGAYAADGALAALAAVVEQSDSAYALDAIGVALETSKVGASTDTAAASDAMAASMVSLGLSATQSDGVYASEAVHARNSELTLPGPKPVRYWRDADLDQLRNAVMELWNDTFGDG